MALSVSCSMLTIANIAADRYRLIFFSERRGNKRNWAVPMLLIGIWTGSLFLASPLFRTTLIFPNTQINNITKINVLCSNACGGSGIGGRTESRPFIYCFSIAGRYGRVGKSNEPVKETNQFCSSWRTYLIEGEFNINLTLNIGLIRK